MDGLCVKRASSLVSTGCWMDNYQSAQQEEIAASDEDISSGSTSATTSGSSQPPMQQQEQPSRVCTSLSWDSGYNEGVVDLNDRFSPTQRRPPCTMRMPSVIVSDCSDDPTENGDAAISLVNGYHHRLNELPSPTLSSHSSSGHEMDQVENHQTASWTWSSSRSGSGAGFLILPGHRGSFDDDATLSSSLLSVRRLSDCSSCSSLATLDMEPCCPGPCSAQAPATSFQVDPHQPFRFDLTPDMTEEEEIESADKQQEDANLPSEETSPTAKVSRFFKKKNPFFFLALLLPNIET